MSKKTHQKGSENYMAVLYKSRAQNSGLLNIGLLVLPLAGLLISAYFIVNFENDNILGFLSAALNLFIAALFSFVMSCLRSERAIDVAIKQEDFDFDKVNKTLRRYNNVIIGFSGGGAIFLMFSIFCKVIGL